MKISSVLLLLLCLLIPCVHAAIFAQTEAQPKAANEERRPDDLILTQGRVQAVAPRGPLQLGQPTQIDLRIRNSSVLKIFSMQGMADPQAVPPADLKAGEQELTLQHRPDGSTYVTLVPQAPGKIIFELIVALADGLDQTSFTADVVAAGPPTSLKLQGATLFDKNILFMNLSPWEGNRRLWLTARYLGVEAPVNIPQKDAEYRVTMDTGPPTIRFDPATANISALRLGHALIEVRYGGLSQSMCVVVGEGGYSRADCSELRPGGSRILPTERGADAPGAEMNSRLPYTGCTQVPRGRLANGTMVYLPVCDGRGGRFLAEDRVNVIAPERSFHLAEENAVQVRVKGPRLAQIRCERQWCSQRTNSPVENPPLSWQQRTDGTASFSIFPSELGDQQYDLTFLFVDGGVAHRTVKTEVVLPTKKPRAIGASCGNDIDERAYMPVILGLRPPGEQRPIPRQSLNVPSIDACYDGLVRPVMVPAPSLRYKILSDGDSAVIRVDEKTGALTQLREGQVLLERSFADFKTYTCVIVATRGMGLSNCRSLRTKYGVPLPGPRNHVRPPDVIVSEQQFKASPYTDTVHYSGSINAVEGGILSPDAHDRFEADDRLEIPLEGFSALFGQYSRLPIRLQGPPPIEMGISQQLTQRVLLRDPYRIQENTYNEPSYTGNRIIRAADGSLGINIFAMQTGTATFRLSILFADGGVAEKMVQVPVKLPQSAPHLFNAAENDGPERPTSEVRTMHLVSAPEGNTRALFPFVSFDEHHLPLPLRPQDVSFSVVQASEPVIRLDAATGMVTALRLGHALVRTRFDGAAMETCVVVMTNLTDGDPSNCEELRGK